MTSPAANYHAYRFPPEIISRVDFLFTVYVLADRELWPWPDYDACSVRASRG